MTRGSRRRGVGRLAMLLGAGTMILLPVGAGALDPLRAAAADLYVAVVIDFGGGQGAPADVVKCVSVPPGSTDAQALSLADDHSTAYATSGLLCGIDTYPPDAVANCKATSGNDYYFWSYWHGTGGDWAYANDGPAEQVVTSGDVEGWRFQDPGPASPSAPAPATAPDFSAICADAVGQPTSGTAPAATGGTSTTSSGAGAATATTGAAAAPATTAPPGTASASPASNTATSPAPGTARGTAGSAPSATSTTQTGAGTQANAAGGRGAGSVTTTSAPASHRPPPGRGARALGQVGGPVHHASGFPWPLVVTGAVVAGLGLASLLRWRRLRGSP